MSGDPTGTATPYALDKAARKRVISRSIWLTVPGTLVLIGAAYRLVPPLEGVEEASARLALASRWLVVAMIPYAAVCLAILAIRFLEGAHDPARGGESERLRLHCRVMQNTLEQFIWFSVCVLAIAPMLAPGALHLIPIVAVVFAGARLGYWWGYLHNGTLARAPAVQVTFTLNIFLLLLALELLARAP